MRTVLRALRSRYLIRRFSRAHHIISTKNRSFLRQYEEQKKNSNSNETYFYFFFKFKIIVERKISFEYTFSNPHHTNPSCVYLSYIKPCIESNFFISYRSKYMKTYTTSRMEIRFATHETLFLRFFFLAFLFL